MVTDDSEAILLRCTSFSALTDHSMSDDELTETARSAILRADTPPGPSGAGREAAARRLLHFEARVRTIVYIDGFNLYYGAVRGTPYRWLDLDALSRALLPKNDLVAIKYFTAIVSARPDDPDQPTRQGAYLRALRTIPRLETEEKGSDVNLATHLLMDAYEGRLDVARAHHERLRSRRAGAGREQSSSAKGRIVIRPRQHVVYYHAEWLRDVHQEDPNGRPPNKPVPHRADGR